MKHLFGFVLFVFCVISVMCYQSYTTGQIAAYNPEAYRAPIADAGARTLDENALYLGMAILAAFAGLVVFVGIPSTLALAAAIMFPAGFIPETGAITYPTRKPEPRQELRMRNGKLSVEDYDDFADWA